MFKKNFFKKHLKNVFFLVAKSGVITLSKNICWGFLCLKRQENLISVLESHCPLKPFSIVYSFSDSSFIQLRNPGRGRLSVIQWVHCSIGSFVQLIQQTFIWTYHLPGNFVLNFFFLNWYLYLTQVLLESLGLKPRQQY